MIKLLQTGDALVKPIREAMTGPHAELLLALLQRDLDALAFSLATGIPEAE